MSCVQKGLGASVSLSLSFQRPGVRRFTRRRGDRGEGSTDLKRERETSKVCFLGFYTVISMEVGVRFASIRNASPSANSAAPRETTPVLPERRDDETKSGLDDWLFRARASVSLRRRFQSRAAGGFTRRRGVRGEGTKDLKREREKLR